MVGTLSDGVRFEVLERYQAPDEVVEVRLSSPWSAVPEEWRSPHSRDEEAWTCVSFERCGSVRSFGGAVWPAAFAAHFTVGRRSLHGQQTRVHEELLGAVFGGEGQPRC